MSSYTCSYPTGISSRSISMETAPHRTASHCHYWSHPAGIYSRYLTLKHCSGSTTLSWITQVSAAWEVGDHRVPGPPLPNRTLLLWNAVLQHVCAIPVPATSQVCHMGWAATFPPPVTDDGNSVLPSCMSSHHPLRSCNISFWVAMPTQLAVVALLQPSNFTGSHAFLRSCHTALAACGVSATPCDVGSKRALQPVVAFALSRASSAVSCLPLLPAAQLSEKAAFVLVNSWLQILLGCAVVLRKLYLRERRRRLEFVVQHQLRFPVLARRCRRQEQRLQRQQFQRQQAGWDEAAGQQQLWDVRMLMNGGGTANWALFAAALWQLLVLIWQLCAS